MTNTRLWLIFPCMKTCFKCNELKPLSEYYKHQMMADGHLNKCKECTKRDSKLNTERNSENPLWVIKERERQRKKEDRRRREGLTKQYVRLKYTRPKANAMVSNAVRDGRLIKLPCQVCGKEKSEGHHEDYSKPLEVVWLCPRHHADRHIHLRDRKTLGIDPMPINEFIAQLAQKPSSPSIG